MLSQKELVGRHSVKALKSAPETPRLHRILNEESISHLGCLKLPNEVYTKSVGQCQYHLMEVHVLGF